MPTACEIAGVAPNSPSPEDKLGIALQTIGKLPINGLRHPPDKGTSGWYIWCGSELSDRIDFFSALHARHIEEYVPGIRHYLDLPPGFRFLVDGANREEIWFDESLLVV